MLPANQVCVSFNPQDGDECVVIIKSKDGRKMITTSLHFWLICAPCIYKSKDKCNQKETLTLTGTSHVVGDTVHLKITKSM